MSGWEIVESELALERPGAAESVFAVGNGYVGVRGAAEEGGPAYDRGVVLNGFHETWPIVYPEDAYGLARTGQTIVAPPDGSVIRLLVDGEPLDVAAARVERVLDMRSGVLYREVEWETSQGRRVLVRSRRLASLADRNLIAIEYEVTALDAPVRIAISSELVTHAPEAAADDPRRGKGLGADVLVPLSAHAAGNRAVLRLATRESGLELACAMDHRFDRPGAVSADGDAATAVFQAALAPGESLRLSKFVAYDWGGGDVERTLDRAVAAGYDAVEADHSAHVQDFWERSDVEIEGAGRAAGGAVQPVPAAAGDGLHGRERRRRQGRDRPRLRGPLLLGHRDLRRPVPRPHDARVGAAGAAVPLRHAARRARARA